MSKQHPHYRRVDGIMQRCYQPNCAPYKNYGGRGISVWEPWRTNRAQQMRVFGSYGKVTNSRDPSDLMNMTRQYSMQISYFQNNAAMLIRHVAK